MAIRLRHVPDVIEARLDNSPVSLGNLVQRSQRSHANPRTYLGKLSAAPVGGWDLFKAAENEEAGDFDLSWDQMAVVGAALGLHESWVRRTTDHERKDLISLVASLFDVHSLVSRVPVSC